jgi:hypothetical protein
MKRTILVMLLLGGVFTLSLQSQQSSPNVSVLPVVVDPNDPDAHLKGDLYLQRQVEPAIGVSTRNASHLVAFFNDYRAVDIPNDPGIGEEPSTQNALVAFLRKLVGLGRRVKPRAAPIAAAEAWIGMSRSHDGGVTWTGAMLPGGPFDNSPASLAAPIHGLQAATDPVVAAAPCGKFYVAFVALTRGGTSMMTVARYEDLNNLEGGDTIAYQGMTVIETGNNAAHGFFLDKPAIAVDPDRSPNAGCGHNVYVSYTTFNGLESNGQFRSKVSFARSTNGAASFDVLKLNPPFHQNQGTAIAVDPRLGTPSTSGGGTVYLVWRHFFNPDTILIHRSTDFGATFPGQPVQVASTPIAAFDQPTLATSAVPPEQIAFRSNGFPTAAVTATGAIYVAWQERVNLAGCAAMPPGPSCGAPQPGGSPRIVVTRSTNGGATWSDISGQPGQRRAIDLGDRDVGSAAPTPGHGYLPQARASGPQVMPRLSLGAFGLFLTYYESRGFVGPNDTILPADTTPPSPGFIAGIDRLLDVRAARLSPTTGQLVGSAQISRYPIRVGANLADGEQLGDVEAVNAPCSPDNGAGLAPCVRRVNRSNAPHSGSGTSPFIGDYIDLTPSVQLVPTADKSGWRWAINPTDVPDPSFRAAFTDNRNLVPPTEPANLLEWQRYPFYAPPGTGGSCLNAGSRNADVLTTTVASELIVSAPTSFKQLGTIQRAFPMTVSNQSAETRFYRLTFATPAMAAIASFAQTNPSLDQVDVQLFPYSSSTRVVYIESGSPTAGVQVNVQQISGLGGSIVPNGLNGQAVLNVDPSNLFVTNAGIENSEAHNLFVTNPAVRSYGNLFVTNQSVSNLFVTNLFVTNLFVTNATIHDAFDVTWAVTATGQANTTSAYTAALNIDNVQAYAGHYAFQLIIWKSSTNGGFDGCTAANALQDQIISNIVADPSQPALFVTNPAPQNLFVTNPALTDANVTNATFVLAPSASAESGGLAAAQSLASNDGTTKAPVPTDTAYVTLRVLKLTANPPVVFNPLVDPPSATVFAHSRNNNGGVLEEPPQGSSAPDLVVAGPVSVAPATVAAGGSVSFPATGWTLANQLTAAAAAEDGAFTHGVYLSTNPALDPNDTRLATAGTSTGILAAGGTQTFGATSVTIPAATVPGAYYLLLMVDEGREVSEQDETNNLVSVPLTVQAGTPPPGPALGFNGPLSPYAPPPASFSRGSSVPILWQYTNEAGVPVDTSTAVPTVTFRKLESCAAGAAETGPVFVNVADPGNSFFQYHTSTNTWQFNWQTKAPITVGCYNIRISLNTTGQVNGPFPIRLR